jgi:hypothetical protein
VPNKAANKGSSSRENTAAQCRLGSEEEEEEAEEEEEEEEEEEIEEESLVVGAWLVSQVGWSKALESVPCHDGVRAVLQKQGRASRPSNQAPPKRRAE